MVLFAQKVPFVFISMFSVLACVASDWMHVGSDTGVRVAAIIY